MKVKIYYQNLRLNIFNLDRKDLIFRPEEAIFITEIDINKNEKLEIAEEIWGIFNCPESGYLEKLRPRFRRAEHTSMSVGDYIKFDDGEIWMVAGIGWEKIKGDKKHANYSL